MKVYIVTSEINHDGLNMHNILGVFDDILKANIAIQNDSEDFLWSLEKGCFPDFEKGYKEKKESEKLYAIEALDNEDVYEKWIIEKREVE